MSIVQFKNIKALIVDGDKDFLPQLCDQLKPMVGKVIPANNGQEALFKFTNEEFQLIITDIKMAKVDGVQLAIGARKVNPNIPIIFISDHLDQYQKEIKSLGNAETLTKPVDGEALENILTKLLAPQKKVIAEELSVKKGDTLFTEGETGDDMYFIKSGSFDVYKKVDDKNQILIASLKTGELVGELSPITGSVRSATVLAHEDAQVLIIPKAKLQDILEGLPKWFKILLPTIISRLNETTMELAKAKKEIENFKK